MDERKKLEEVEEGRGRRRRMIKEKHVDEKLKEGKVEERGREKTPTRSKERCLRMDERKKLEMEEEEEEER